MFLAVVVFLFRCFSVFIVPCSIFAALCVSNNNYRPSSLQWAAISMPKQISLSKPLKLFIADGRKVPSTLVAKWNATFWR